MEISDVNDDNFVVSLNHKKMTIFQRVGIEIFYPQISPATVNKIENVL